ncbi:hypothetical protein CcaverHIS631_0303850 [Cutaneotrichosporon cavernicola]|nr:hypothetical protein CcaverHIS631_0303850 [Cutaneotrichosporon cavernicola]
MGYHAREPSGRSQYTSSRRPSQAQAIPTARRNSTYGYSFRETVPPPIIDDKYWVEGDFEIVSADAVRFCVPSYYLLAASAVFREAGVLDVDPGRDDIEMLSGMDDIDGVDPPPLPGVVHARYLRLSEPTETAAVLRLFLAFASTGHLTIPDDGTTLDSLEHIRALILFLTKYECEGTLSLVLTVLREAVRMPSSVSPLSAFVAGASAGDAFTCSVALDVTDWTWRMMDRHDLPAAPDANVFDPHHMPVAVWQLIPPMYTWALTTAWSGDTRNVRRERGEERREERREDEYDDDAAHRSAVGSRCDSTLGRRVHAWQQWLVRTILLYIVLPLLPIYLQAYVLLGKQGEVIRAVRRAAAGVAVGGIVKAWLSFRFTDPKLNAFNNGFTVVFIHLALKSLEFALLHDGIVDPWPNRPRWRAALDLCLNSRMLGLGSVGIDDTAGPPNGTVDRPVLAGYLRHLVPPDSPLRPLTHTARRARLARRRSQSFSDAVQEAISPSSTPGPSRPITPQNTKATTSPHPTSIKGLWSRRPTSRTGAIARHVLHVTTHYVVLDTFLAFLHHTGLELSPGGRGTLERYVLQSRFIALPDMLGGRLAHHVPPGILTICIEACVPIVIWQGLNLGYHVAAVIFLCAGWEVESWNVDLFDAPWRADSIIDLWGRRWHQLFRHQFILAAASTLKLLRLPNRPALLFPLVFVFSGLLHVLGEMSMDPVPSTGALWAFFLLSGVGCALEITFKTVTGRRVRGMPGRLWCWVYTFVIGRLAADAWLDAGVAGCSLLPRGGAGEYIAPLLIGRLFERVP